MPLHGKIVVIKRSGGDGTEFPLTATCLFGRKPDCDIRIQLPQVSKEHCRIDLNENKEIILTNLSSVNPTRVNGEVLQQSERLKHGDVITIIDRSFRFEYPPAPTPKKRSSTGGKTETLKVLQDQQVGDTVTSETGDKRTSEVSTDPHLKDGTNHDNIQRSLEKTLELESKEDDSLLQNKTASPFNDLYQMIKKSLDVKTPRKSSASLLQTPTSRFCTPKPVSVRKNDEKPFISTEEKGTPQKDEAKVCPGADETKEAENISNGTPKSVKKQRRSSQGPSTAVGGPEVEKAEKSETTTPQKRIRTPPQRYTACEVIEQITAQSPKSPLRRRSKEAKPAVTQEQQEQAVTSPKTECLRKASPRNSGSPLVEVEKVKEMSKKRKSGELAADLPTPQVKKKRVSFGGYLCPELFDKRLPPDSPLRKGATPRRSFCVSKPQSLLRRASVIGSLQFDEEHPDSPNVQSPAKMRTPSPKKSSAKNASPKTPTPGKKSPKSRSPSPKARSPAQKSPKSNSPSPKATSPGKKSPKSRSPSPKATSSTKKSPKPRTPSPKATSPGQKSPKSRSPSPKATSSAKKSPKPRTPSPKAASPAKKTPKSRSPSPARGGSPTVGGTPGVQTPKIQGRFSVSRISTPSPNAEDAVTDQVPSVTVTPKMPLRRKSISQETSSAAKVMRRSGISRASLKAKNSWANVVRFGQPKAQVVAPAKKAAAKMTKKKTVPKPKTPARKIQGHFSTGHADSPVTIVVGRAHKQRVVHPTGAAPRMVTNTALLKKNMKMDEDLTGISEMFKTPVTERKTISVINEDNATKTPVGALGTSVVEPSVLNTPEEPGEMMVSPLSVASTVKDRRYNSEAVQRLLNDDQESSFVSDVPALEIHSDDSGEQQCTDLKTTSQTTPKQKPELPECLTGVKRIMKTPRQKAEPVEDLRGRLLKTPKQKPEQQECLTGVKRIMRTPRQKAEPVEDLRGRLLKTPKQKPEQQECLTGVKRIMKTPRQKAEPVEDLRGTILKTPKQKPEQQECLTGVKRMMETPRQEAEPVEDVRVELLTTPKQKPEQQECLTGVKSILNTPQQQAESHEDLQEKPLETPKALEAADVSLDDKELVETPDQVQESEDFSEMADMNTPDAKSSQQECLTGIKRIMKTPKERSPPVEDMVGVKRLMKTPREKGEPVEENFGIKRLVKTPKLSSNAPMEDFEGLQELMEEEPQTEATEQLETNEQVEDQTPLDCEEDVAKELDFAQEEPQDNLPSDVIDSVPQDDTEKEDANEVVVDDHSEGVPSGHDNNELSDAVEPLSEPAVNEISAEQPKVDTVDENLSEDKPDVDAVDENSPVEQPEVDAVDESSSEEQPKVEMVDEKSPVEQPEVETAPGKVTEIDTTATDPDPKKKSVRGRRAKTVEPEAAADKQEAEVAVVSAPVRGRRGKKAEASAPPAVRQTARGRNAKSQESTSDDKPEMTPETAVETTPVTEISPEAVSDPPSPVKESEGKKAEATAPQVPVTESLPEEETCKVTEMDAAVVEKKTVRGRRAKLVESKSADDNQEAAEHSEEPVAPTPVKGRRGKKTEAAAGPPAVRQTTRGRNAKSQESNDVELTEQKTASLPSETTLKARRGRKASDDQVETVQEVAAETEMVPESKSEQSPPVEVDLNTNDSAAPQEKAALKPKRGRKTKQPEESVPEQQDLPSTHSEDVPETDTAKEADANEVCSDQLEVLPSGSDENKLSDAMETVPQTPVTESLPEVETATCIVTEMDAAVVQKKTVRGRKAKLVESKSDEDKPEATEYTEDPVVPAPVRGRRGKKTEAAAPAAVRHTRRGRNAKSQENTSEDKPEVDTVDENSSEEPKVETAPGKVTEIDTTATDTDHKKKSVRGRRAKTVEPKAAEDKQEAEDAVVSAPVRGRRGKKAEAAAPPAVRQTARGRNAKSQESTSDDKPEMTPETAVETTPVTEISPEAVSDQPYPVKESDPAPPVEEAVVKPVRGRKTKQTPVEPPQPETEKTELVSDEPVVTDTQPEKSVPTLAKPKRGRKTKPDTVEQNEVAEDTVVTVETKQQSEPPVRAKRGRNAKQEEEKQETTESQEPAKKIRRGTRKAEQDHVEPQEEVQTVEMVVPEEAEATLVAEPVKVEQATVAAKPRRGGRKAKHDTESETPVEPTEAPAVTSTDKVKRGGRGKQVTEEVAVTAVVPEEKPDHESEAKETDAEPDSPVIKQSRARGAKTSSKNEASQAIPAKRARRGAALPLEETNAEVSEPASTSVEPAKRGRRAAAKPTADDATVTDDQANPTEESSSAVVEDIKTSKRSVKWKADVEVFDIPKATPVKAVRGRKSKLDTESKNVSKDDDKTEEKDLSEKVIEAQPVKRARRGAKVADVTADEAESTSKVNSVEAETQQKTRRGRPAKK